MRNPIYFSLLFALMLSSCGSLKHADTFDDDAYYDPIRDRPKKDKKVKQTSAADSIALAQKTRLNSVDTNNKYYKTPGYNTNDYYDNEYACRMRRFNGNNIGVGYYDSYYTNSYFYDQNPYHYNVSVYNGYNNYSPTYWNYAYNPNYNWGGWNGVGNNYNWGYGNGFGNYTYPSSYFNCSPYTNGNPYYSSNSYWGNSYGNNGYGNSNNYGYGNNSWFYYGNPYWGSNYYNGYGCGNYYGSGYGYDPYGYGYGNGYGYGYGNGYGGSYYGNGNGNYNNSYDGSSFYGPRNSHGGVNPDISLKVDNSNHKTVNPNGNNGSGNNNDNNSLTSGSTLNNVSTTSNPVTKAPDDINRFDAIPVQHNVSTNNVSTSNSVQTEAWDSKPSNNFGTNTTETNGDVNQMNSTPNNVKGSEQTAEPEKGFWGKIFSGNNNSTAAVSDEDYDPKNPNNANNGNNSSSGNSGAVRTVKQGNNTSYVPNTYTPNNSYNPHNNNNNVPKNNYNPNPPSQNNYNPTPSYTPSYTPSHQGGGGTVIKPH